MEALETYRRLFENYREVLRLNAAPQMDACRDEAAARWLQAGFPSTRSEAYRHFDLQEALSIDYGMNLYRLGVPAHPGDVFRCDVPSLSTQLFFIVNDLYYPSKRPVQLPEGVLCGSLSAMLREHADLLQPYYHQLCRQDGDAMAAMNTAFVQDGFVLYVPAHVAIDKPIQLIQMFQGEIDIMATRRLLVILDEGASASLIVCDHAITSSRYFSNQVAEIFVGKDASLSYYEMEMTHDKTCRVANTYIRQEEGSRFLTQMSGLENGITRNNITLTFAGRHASASLSGLTLLSRSQQTDNHVLVDHAVPDCQSDQLYKYVLDDESRAVFGGRVLVRPDAQHTEARQSSASLCSTERVRMWSQPQLEIYADDVKCGHGSATGQIDENALFYMRQRGLSEEEARMFLKFAFASQVVDRIELGPLQDRMRMLVGKRFRGELAKCIDCKICP